MKKYKRIFMEVKKIDYKKILNKILKKIPSKYRKGVNFEITSKPLRTSAYYHDNTIYIDITEFRQRFTSMSNVEELRKKYDSFIVSSSEDFDLKVKDNVDYSELYLLNVLCHELGHFYLDKLKQIDEKEYDAFLIRAEKLLKSFNSKTIMSYVSYYNDDDDMSLSPLKNTKILKEKIAEAFRLFILEHKFSNLFKI